MATYNGHEVETVESYASGEVLKLRLKDDNKHFTQGGERQEFGFVYSDEVAS